MFSKLNELNFIQNMRGNLHIFGNLERVRDDLRSPASGQKNSRGDRGIEPLSPRSVGVYKMRK